MDWPTQEVIRIRSSDLTWREVEGEVIALDLRASLYLTTNRTGARLWNLLVDGSTFSQMSAFLVGVYSLSVDAAANDVTSFLELLHSHSLLDQG